MSNRETNTPITLSNDFRMISAKGNTIQVQEIRINFYESRIFSKQGGETTKTQRTQRFFLSDLCVLCVFVVLFLSLLFMVATVAAYRFYFSTFMATLTSD